MRRINQLLIATPGIGLLFLGVYGILAYDMGAGYGALMGFFATFFIIAALEY